MKLSPSAGKGNFARGYFVMKGYDDEPEATERTIDQDGWLHTGDLAVMRPDGYLNITGRARDMIVRGGENIYPREIENLLYTHPKVADAGATGVEPAASCVTGGRSNQLNYAPAPTIV